MRNESGTGRAAGLAGALVLWSSLAAAQTAPPRYGPPPAGPATVPPPMQSGGLAPPPPMQSGGLTPPPGPGAWQSQGSTAATLAEADRSDSGRGLEFVYIQPEVGVEYVSLGALHSGSLLPADSKSSGFGVVAGGAAGVRLLFFSVGPHFRFAHFSDFDLFTIDLELGWRVPLGSLDVYGTFGGGYAWLTHDPQPEKVDGYNFRLAGGADYYFTNVLSLGGQLSFDLQRLQTRVPVPVPPGGSSEGATTYGLGLGVTASLLMGLHF